MVAFFLFSIHIVVVLYAFISERKKESWGVGLLAVGFMGIIFAVGWTIATMLTNLLFATETFVKWYYAETGSFFLQTLRRELNRDTIALLFLTAGEIVFYYFYLREEPTAPSAT